MFLQVPGVYLLLFGLIICFAFVFVFHGIFYQDDKKKIGITNISRYNLRRNDYNNWHALGPA